MGRVLLWFSYTQRTAINTLLIPMKFRSISKFAIFWFLVYILGCAGGPKVKEIAALHYGDDEAEIIEILGEGFESLFFKLGNTNYSYRYYTTSLTEHQYALLFAEGKLYAVSEDKPLFYQCTSQIDWEICFRLVISQMQSEHVTEANDDFSEALAEEENREEAITEANTTAVVKGVISVPVLVVLLPFNPDALFEAAGNATLSIIGSGPSMVKSECTIAFENIEESLDVHYPNSNLSHVINTIKIISKELDITSTYAGHDYDISKGNRRIYGKHWTCGNYRYRKDLTTIYGAEDNELTWVFKSAYVQEYTRSIALFCQAADQGNMRARRELGKLYLYGSDKYKKSVPIDIQESMNINIQTDLSRACMWFHLAGQAQITENMEQRPDKTVHYFSAEVERTAKVMTAHQLDAAEKLVQAWQPGNCASDLSRQMITEHAKDPALEMLCSAADRGDHTSRSELGRIYFFGSRGVPEDLTRAYMWYRLAEDVYVPHGGPAMQKLCNDMTPEQRVIAVGLIEEWKPGICEKQVFN